MRAKDQARSLFSINSLELAIRIWAAFYVCIYGVAKVIQFKNAVLLDVPISEATPAQIMWAFFGTTTTYPVLIGSIQVLGAVLLVFRKTRLLGALVLTPVFFNIILLDILYRINEGALINAIIFQLVFFGVMYQDRKKLQEIFRVLVSQKEHTSSFSSDLIFFGFSAILAAGLFFAYPYLIRWIFWNV